MANLNEGVLRDLPLFDGLEPGVLEFMAEKMQEVSVPIGGHIVKAGDFAYRFFVILAGSAAVSRDGSAVAGLAKGDIFGEMALVDDTPRNADVVATTPMTLLALMSWDFREALVRFPEFKQRVERVMAERE
ncbi:MAG TPA: cyclic nucleotide-binding domain-containing protein [Acidimicrobiia bacterium]|nr:cyclic nucleotide-binding domain-containing protein [Acidimicrobiia bacterium]